jgi:hypothetical protein
MQLRGGRRYGGRFHNGFANFLQTGELNDCTVVVCEKEYKVCRLAIASIYITMVAEKLES